MFGVRVSFTNTNVNSMNDVFFPNIDKIYLPRYIFFKINVFKLLNTSNLVKKI